MGDFILRYQTVFVSCAALAIANLAVARASAQQVPATANDKTADPSQDAVDPVAAPAGTIATVADRTPEKKKKDTGTAGDDIQVTGSRLQNGNPTSRVIVITEAEIKARGVSSVEDLMRTIPQNVGTIGTLTNERTRGPLVSRNAPVTAFGQLGVSAANLGGLGAGNTLVLVNGRRIAGAAGIQDGFANLNGIPLNAIERVEITLDGASAIYGSDAIGGVINFIMKSNFRGVTLSAQHLHSENDADVTRFSAFAGVGWGGGNLTGTLGFDRRLPVNNYKSGYTTEDYSSFYDGDPNFDRRSFTRGLQPGVAVRRELIPGSFLRRDAPVTVRPGVTGRPTEADLIPVDVNSKRDYVAELAGPKSDSINATLNFKQDVTDKLSVFANGLFSRTTNREVQNFGGGLALQMATGQYYNPFPNGWMQDGSTLTSVYYYPADEIATGELEVGTMSNTVTSWNLTAGLTYQFNPKNKIDLVYSRSRSSASGSVRNFNNAVNIVAVPNANSSIPPTFRCESGLLSGTSLTAEMRTSLQAAFDRQCIALTSTDPNLAFNPWKTSAGGPGASVADFFYLQAVDDRASTLQNFEARMSGSLFKLPGGDLSYAFGGELTIDGVNSSEVRVFTSDKIDRNRYAGFAELNLPVLGKDLNFPLVKALTFNIQARFDSYQSEGAIGTVNNVPFEQGGQLIYDSSRFSKVTPAYGVRWDVTPSLVLRGRLTKGFKAPDYTQLYNVVGSFTSPFNTILGDPLYDCSTAPPPRCNGRRGQGYIAALTTAPNPDLKPQTSTQQSLSATWKPEGFLRGLSIDALYNHTRIRDQFASLADLTRFMTTAESYKLAEFHIRNSDGRIIESRNKIFNITGSEFSSLTITGSYLIGTGIGRFQPQLTYVKNIKSETQGFPNIAAVSTLGRLDGADRYKLTGSLGWYFHDISANLWAYHTPNYVNDYVVDTFNGIESNPQLARPVRAYTTIDLTTSWRVNNAFRINFAGRNIFDAAPPFVVVGSRPYDVARYNPAGRTLSLEAQFTF